jgi:ubiquinone/menaquinone biosynthesis C-methylase UbiE
MTQKNKLKELIIGMRNAYHQGENMMAWARKVNKSQNNSILSSMIAYDLQAGNYIERAKNRPDYEERWSHQLAGLLSPYLHENDSLLEIGVGEATTLAGVMNKLQNLRLTTYGFDLSWSRIHMANQWMSEKKLSAGLFVADLFNIPLADNCIDVVYTSHSLEPNGGREVEALKEILRITRRTLVLVEPIYEEATTEGKKRMRSHGYVKNLQKVIKDLGYVIEKFYMLDFIANPLNPSGVIVVQKNRDIVKRDDPLFDQQNKVFQCPITATELTILEDVYVTLSCGLVYPILRNIPMLRAENAIIASKIL